MKTTNKKRMSTETLVLAAVMTALVVVLQSLATYTAFFGPFSTAVALVPIVIGAAMCGSGIGAWLGFVFGIVVLATGNAALFWGFDIPGTIITVLLKVAACGFVAGLVYRLLKKFNDLVAVTATAIICPVVNTGVFLLGSYVFFLEHAKGIAEKQDLNLSGMELFWALAMGNFVFEVVLNIVLAPVIVRLLNIRKKD